MTEIERFYREKQENIKKLGESPVMESISKEFINESAKLSYTYHFSWLGRPIIQYPQDIQAVQEIIWDVKPDLVIETGIAHGGSLIMSASMLAMLDYMEAVESGEKLDPKASKRKVLGIDIDIREHNSLALKEHPMSVNIRLIEGDSLADDVISQVRSFAQDYQKILLLLDSNHTHEHVLTELNAYSDLVSKGSYCIVFDTVIEDMPKGSFPDRSWDVGNNPKTAVKEFLSKNKAFIVDEEIHNKLLVTNASGGYLKKIN